MQNHCIGFLHTSSVHIKTFATICEHFDPSVSLIHLVDEDLLARAQNEGLTASIKTDIQKLLEKLVEQGAEVVVCTCSSIGSAAELIKFENVASQRIDRAMADKAVLTGKSLLILAALDSTLVPTKLLIEQSAQNLAQSVKISTLKVEGAWQSFESNNLTDYHQKIAAKIKQQILNYDVIVLAQASMAGATQYCEGVDTPILSSPELGVLAALTALKKS